MFFVRVVVIQQRKVRHTAYQNLCNVVVKQQRIRKPNPSVIRLPGQCFHPFVPGHCLQEKHAVFADFGGRVDVNAA